MKTNKKALMGMLVAMVMSLGVVEGIDKKAGDTNVQQLGAACAVASCLTEGGTSKDLALCGNALALTAAAGAKVPGAQLVAAFCGL
ncbi:MAG: hypothetical protein J5900_05325 [Prevotella sp.]|nr:hypothetical protein [Prevotella sp.]